MLYLKIGVLLLTDIFKNCIVECKEDYGNNPVYSDSTPYFTRQEGVKSMGVKLEFITDDRFRLFLENNMRGGTSSCLSNRHLKRERKLLCE